MILNYQSRGLIAIDRCKISPRCRRGIGAARSVKSSYWIDIRHANVSLYTCSSTGNSSHSTLIRRLACDRHSNDTTSHQPFDYFSFFFFFFFSFLLPHFSVRLTCDVRWRVHETRLPKKQFDVHLSTPWNYTLKIYQSRVTSRIVSNDGKCDDNQGKFLLCLYYQNRRIDWNGKKQNDVCTP